MVKSSLIREKEEFLDIEARSKDEEFYIYYEQEDLKNMILEEITMRLNEELSKITFEKQIKGEYLYEVPNIFAPTETVSFHYNINDEFFINNIKYANNH